MSSLRDGARARRLSSGFLDPPTRSSEPMKRTLYVSTCLAILSGSSVSAPVITDIETDNVTVALIAGNFEANRASTTTLEQTDRNR